MSFSHISYPYFPSLPVIMHLSRLEIVREKTTSAVSTIKGQAIRERHMEMTYDTTDKDSNIKRLPLFADINVRTLQHTFTHPKGPLFATQFAQIAFVVTSRRLRRYVLRFGPVGRRLRWPLTGRILCPRCYCRYPAKFLSHIVFYRGLTMQLAVGRDEQHRAMDFSDILTLQASKQ
ncbi:hypothetical protein F5888DRAFT_1806955 [Russula emetica]|nr:hypothetical protein F5888DRAFT_1806955 [Russula emetica]